MKKFLTGVVLCTLVIFIGRYEARAFSVSGMPPTGTLDDAAASTAFYALLDDVNVTLNKYDSSDLATGFSNANAYASHGATMRAFQGYDLFTISVGTMAGVQAPSFDINKLKDVPSDLEDEGDIYAGLAWQPWTVQVGLNSSFLLEDLYLAAKFGFLNVSYGPATFDTFNIGVLANYQFIREKSLFLNVLVWRGVSFGTGLIYQYTKADVALSLDTLTLAAGAGETVYLDQDVIIGVESTNVVIPLEATTAVRLLWILNISVGAGMDIVFGESTIGLEADGDVYAITDTTGLQSGDAGYFYVDGTTTSDPEMLRPKLMANVGIGIGPVVIDIPVTWYLNSGANIGITVGIVW